jgi:methylenetetrahydrofolate reductase (NADPH)
MLRVFQNELLDPSRFIITLELVPGRQARGHAVDAVMAIARDAFADGRVSAVSITDNPGGNPSLSPDVIGAEIFKLGMDVIVHFTCRDTNRVGMESRALQLAMLGMKNILALTGDYSGQGFGGQGAPVFDLDSVQLQILLDLISERIVASGDPDPFFTGCAVSPFKSTEAESFAQYAKLCRKTAAGAQYVITQLGYDARKFLELRQFMVHAGLDLPVLGSVYLLTPKVASIMNQGRVPGAVVTDALLADVQREWRDKAQGRRLAIERAAQLGALLKGLGYRGMHIGGVHKSFATVARILDRMAEIEADWQTFWPNFDYPQPGGFYAFDPESRHIEAGAPRFGRAAAHLSFWERIHYSALRRSHDLLFTQASPLTAVNRGVARLLDRWHSGGAFLHITEDALKKMILRCQRCGDCAIQHVGFLCPEAGCPKHMRNGACGGSRNGRCEVYPERDCVWVRAHRRLAQSGHTDEIRTGCVPPRMWELNRTSSWLNYHLGRDHQANSSELVRKCGARTCQL